MNSAQKATRLNEKGLTLIEIVFVGVFLFIIILLFMKNCGTLGSVTTPVPTAVSVVGPSTIAEGSSETYTVTITTNVAEVTAKSYEVVIEEDDSWWDDYLTTVTVTVAAKATTGSEPFTLKCEGGVIKTDDGSDDELSPGKIQAEAKRMLWALRSEKDPIVQCVAEVEPTE